MLEKHNRNYIHPVILALPVVVTVVVFLLGASQ
ncbi:hypothetical protein VP150E351_P0074 [Vibrio phage 150E35-1]|nr:hypothetical protein VP150E351_P0074 [Vibrio phage 150E35-1]